MNQSTLKALICLGAAVLACACGGGGASLDPEIASHLDQYENLIAEFEPRFAAVRNNQPEFAKVANSYAEATQAWMSRWETVAPNPTEEEGRAITTRIDKLNRRAEKMLTG